MTEIRFYHLERTTLDQALPQIAAKAYSVGHKIAVLVSDTKEAERLNDVLWTYNPASFLPHGTKKDSQEPDQPIWITAETVLPQGRDVAIMTSGIEPDNISDFALICDIFDGAQPDQLQAARARWKKFKDYEEITLTYFQQNDRGGWEKKQ